MNKQNHFRVSAARLFAAGMLLASTGSALAAVRYVDVNSTNATPPYTNWTTAAKTIQDAVDAAMAGDEIVVTNGIYATGARTVDGYTTNRVAVDKPLSLRSISGPQLTTINGGASVRCVYLTNGASLSGFTLTNGFAEQGAGVWCESTNAVVSNCVISGNSFEPPVPFLAFPVGGGAYGGTLNNCVLSDNRVGAFYPFVNAVFRGLGGGAYGATLNNCTLSGNSALSDGGGATGCTLNDCTLTGNSAPSGGGGASGCTLNNCTLTGNSAGQSGWDDGSGGGANGCTLNNCTLTGNSAPSDGGGAFGSTLNNCTLTGNSADGVGGGVYGGTLNNCIVYYNTAPQEANYSGGGLNYCCTMPDPGGIGNITNAPLFVDTNEWANLRLQSISPCINAGNNAYAVGSTDLDGNSRIKGGRVDMGAYEFEVVHYVDVNSTNATPPYTNWTTAATNIQDAVDAAVAGDEIVVTNGTYAPVVVDTALSLRSVNGPTVTIIDGGNLLRCVYLTNGARLSGFTLTHGVGQYGHGSSGEPGPVIGGGLWCESASAVASNCVVSGNLARATGGGIVSGSECRGGGVYGGTLINCTLSGNEAIGVDSNGVYPAIGGGAADATLNNCTITRNLTSSGVLFEVGGGGGVAGCTLHNCTLSDNASHFGFGGGAADSSLNNCTVIGNRGGACYSSSLTNCIVYFNGDNYDYLSTLNYCCTTPLPTNGIGNITNAPLFVDTNGWANLRLQSNSPCINAGLNALAPDGPDLDGNPRIAGGTVDIGAYEFQSPTSIISYAWLQQYGLTTNGSADTADSDGDGLSNWQEWICGTDPNGP